MTFSRTVVVVACAMLSACSLVPDVNHALDASPTSLPEPSIVGTTAPLAPTEKQAILARLEEEGIGRAILQRQLALEEQIAKIPLVAGNRTRLLLNGPNTFRAKFDAIRRARNNINLEYFIIEDVESDGTRLSDLLVKKRQEGVAINIIYDSYGSALTDSAFFDRLREAGVKLVSFNPLDPLDAKTSYAPNERDHRKVLIVDGTLAIMGGINLSTDYTSNAFGRPLARKAKAGNHLRDTGIEIEGPVVTELQKFFFETWGCQNGPSVDDSDYFPFIPPKGDEVIRIIASTSNVPVPRFYAVMLSAFRNANKNIWLTTAYFIPSPQGIMELTDAARRGVDVRLLLPTVTDTYFTIGIQHSHYDDLLNAGVKIYESESKELHSKSLVIDGVWSAIGSSNFDHRSVLYNDEIDASVLGKKTGKAFERIFENDINNAREITLEEWNNRSLIERADEKVARIWENWL
jgi:cardiolipin synthase